MNRPVIIVALLMSMLLQTVTLGGHWFGALSSSGALHSLMHWAGLSHHHDHAVAQAQAEDDSEFEAFAAELAEANLNPHQSFHLDHSVDSSHHMSQDACVSAMGPIPASLSGAIIANPSPRPLVFAEAARPDPVLASLRRPPRHLA